MGKCVEQRAKQDMQQSEVTRAQTVAMKPPPLNPTGKYLHRP